MALCFSVLLAAALPKDNLIRPEEEDKLEEEQSSDGEKHEKPALDMVTVIKVYKKTARSSPKPYSHFTLCSEYVRLFIFYTANFLFPTQVGLFLNPRLPLLQTPSLWFPCVDVFFVILTHHSTEAMLEPHAKAELGMTQGQVGLAFLLMGGSYLTFTLLAGKVHLG